MPLPNSGKMNRLISQLSRRTVQLGLYKNVVTPTDGSLTAYSLTEMPTSGGRGYAPMELARTINLSALAASQWYIALNSSGKAQAQYSNAALQWTMTSVEVGDANTPQGGFGYCWFLPFDGGAGEIRVGDHIKGGTTGATAVVTDVVLISGSWAAGTAAGYLYLETKSGSFQDDEAITLIGLIVALAVGANAGANYANGDIFSVTQANATEGVGVVTANSGGAVTSTVRLRGGENYTSANGLATSKVTGNGDNNLTANITALPSVTMAQTNTGTENSGDAHKELMFLSAIATPVQITTIGQPITITPTLTEDTDPTVG